MPNMHQNLEFLPVPESELRKDIETLQRIVFAGIKTFVAGGSARKLITNEEIGNSDIDFFFPNKEEMLKADARLREYGFYTKEHPNCKMTSFWCDKLDIKMRSIQLITKGYHKDMKSLLDDFDFTISQFGYLGGNVVSSVQSRRDFELKILRKASKVNRANPARLVKFIRMGFNPEIAVVEEALLGQKSLSACSYTLSMNGEDYGNIDDL